MKIKKVLLLLILVIVIGCKNEADMDHNPTIISTPITNTPSMTSITPSSTHSPYEYGQIGLPMSVEDIKQFKDNFNCPTNYGDFSHDGVDIVTKSGIDTPIIAVDDGSIWRVSLIDGVGYEIYQILGFDSDKNPVIANYVHLDKIDISEGQIIKKGTIIGYVNKYDHLYFAIRIGYEPRMEFPSDGNPGDEVDITDILLKFIPKNIIGYDDRIRHTCRNN